MLISSSLSFLPSLNSILNRFRFTRTNLINMSIAALQSTVKSNELEALPNSSLLTSNPVPIQRIMGLNPSPYTLQGSNLYLIGHETHNKILIDTGDGFNDEYIHNLKLALHNTRISSILITHYHWDHTGGINKILNLFPTIEQPKVFKFKSQSLPGGKKPNLDFNISNITDKPIQYEEIQENEQQYWKIEGSDCIIKPIITPGHTSDHVSFLLTKMQSSDSKSENTEENHVIFSGDCILGSGSSQFRNLSDYMYSLRKLDQFQAKFIYPGHGQILTNPTMIIQQYIQHRMAREKQIMQVLTDSSSNNNKEYNALEIVEKIYPQLDPIVIPAAVGNVLLHLGKLLKEQKITVIGQDTQVNSMESNNKCGCDNILGTDAYNESESAETVIKQQMKLKFRAVSTETHTSTQKAAL